MIDDWPIKIDYPPLLAAATAPSSDLLRPLLAASAARHKHLCPRQVLGVRIGLRGLLALGLIDGYQKPFTNHRKRLLTIVEMDGCGADGISAATDCHVGRRTLRVLDYGKMAATLVDTKTDRAIRVRPHPQVRQRAKAIAPHARSRWHAYLEAYQILPDEALLQVQSVTLTQSLAEILSRPNVRTNCQECGEEIMNEREVAVDGRILCRSCAGDRYYTSRT